MSEATETTGLTIRQLRQQTDLTQEEFARLCRITRRTLAFWEAGEYLPSGRLVQRVAEALGVKDEVILRAAKNSYAKSKRKHRETGSPTRDKARAPN